MDNIVWVGRWQHVVALAIKDEKTFNVTQVFTLITPETLPDHMRTRKYLRILVYQSHGELKKGRIRSYEN